MADRVLWLYGWVTSTIEARTSNNEGIEIWKVLTKQRFVISGSCASGFIGAAAREANVPMHKIRTMRRSDPMFDQAVRYLGWVGRGFCDVTAGSDVDDIPAVKRYLTRLGMKG